ncbi:MAG TPA: RdgB/HAM1 family non-canonical purine NTP pyrophosphatase [bacterium]|jgi:XTP/dITP diphosphohydrolase|nr:RdgB/HAM1 family non-canonical purine NTP pyrophosphatase [bacterium]HOX87437.1 RdgB/HAM1 family non-canonical purine NTP pyrophosphatase [bacterium]HPG46898.1 RdgB/HAM1 family non-canonical purine NTP pyrophosphatase [bacterium]HPM99122.1 RdgB/HAM1 family non-canonical purine NTP pyrophosphatase [bacterium]
MSRFSLLLATRNRDKVVEIRQVLAGLDVEVISAIERDDLPEIEEDRDTLEGNASKKALVCSRIAQMASLADDTGLEVDALNGKPGVFSSRFAGENATYDDNVNKLLHEMAAVPSTMRGARFRCVMALAIDGRVETVEGVCEGEILFARRGEGGFGYDPVFYLPALDKTFAELSIEEKNRISHRGIALRKAVELIRAHL